jgi:plasmid stabilization system protein ParE
MTPYRLMPAAELDLAEIVDYIARDSPQNAMKVFDRIHLAARNIAEMPGMGHRREDVTDKPVLFWAVYSYLLVYRPDKRPLEILRIVHGARDLPRVLGLED